MKRRCQKHDQNTREYFFDKLILCKALNLTLNETVTLIAVRLYSRATSN